MTDLYVRDRCDGDVHRVGDNIHDVLIVDESGIVQYYNLQNGEGTLCGDKDEKEAGYEFVQTDEYGDVDEETEKQADEYRAGREEFHRRQKELAERGIILID